MWFGILGPLEAHDGEREIDLGPPKQQAVLAALLLEANHAVAVDRLIDLVWGDDPPAQAAGALQVYISGLREAFEPDRPKRTSGRYILYRSGGYMLHVRPDELDATRFEELFAEGHRLLDEGRVVVAQRLLREALALWRGPALGELGQKPFAYADAARLGNLRITALEDRIAADLALGHHTTAIAELEALVLEHPLRERLWALLMLALYRSDRQSDALRAYARARTVLCEELGLEPGPSLRQLEQEILEHADSLAWRPPPTDPLVASATGGPGAQLVGRAKELRTLDALLADADARRGGLVLVSGEPGIGKTRLVQEMVARAVARGALVTWGRCHEGEGAPSFWPWVQVIRDLLRGGKRETLQRALLRGAGEVAQISPEVKELVPEFDPPPVLDPAAARFRLYEAVNDMVGGMASERPLVVVLDDLHWADVPSLKLTEFVAAHTPDTGAVVVAAFRDVDPAVGGPLADTLGVLARHPALHRIGLDGLSEAECTQYIEAAFGVTPSSAVAATIHARTDGNPFFVGELARLLAGDGALEGEHGPVERVPVGVRDVIRRRLRCLPEATNELLAQAAVLGRDVDLRTLAVAVRTDQDVAADQLAECVDRAILVTHPDVPGRYVFSHALVQHTVLGEVNLSRRAKLHARAAAALRVVHGNDEAVAVELAHHLYEATPVVGLDEAHDAALRAAEVSQRRLAYEQAEHQLRRALELLARVAPGPDRWHRELDVQHRLAALLSVTDGYQSAGVAAAWERARELCRKLGDTPEVLTSLVGLARLTRTRGQYGLCINLGEQLQSLADETLSSAFAVASHEARGHAKLFVGKPAEAAAHLTEVLRLADVPSPDDPTVVLYPGIAARAYLACARWLLGDDESAEELSRTACEMAVRTHHPLTIAISQLYAAKLASMRGDPREALRWTVKVEGLARSGSIGPLEPVRVILVCWARARLGNFQAGEAGFVRPLAQLRASEWRLAFSYFLALKGDAHRAAGHFDQALDAVRQGLAEAEATGEHYYEPELYRLAGELTVARWPDRVDEAESWLHRAVAEAQAQGAVAWERRARASLSRLTARPPR
jgi:DNA-binding SARP family transcriptional activator